MSLPSIPSNTVAKDSFLRTSASGWGTADQGGSWTQTGNGGSVGATDSTVASGAAAMNMPTSGTIRSDVLASTSIADVDVYNTFSVAPSGGAVVGGAIAMGTLFRYADTTHYYLAQLEVANADQGMTLKLWGYGNGNVLIGSKDDPVNSAGYFTGQQLTMRVQATKSRIRVKVWDTSIAEPLNWDLTVYDTGSVAAGAVGVRSISIAANTNTRPLVFTYNQFFAAPATIGADMFHSEGNITVEAAFGADQSLDPSLWPWQDITADVFYADKVNITQGRGDETSQAQPAALNFTLLNTTGNYTPYHQKSIYFPNVKRDTPIRVRFDHNDGNGSKQLFFGYAVGFNPVWSITGSQALIQVTAAGALRRLTQGTAQLHSVMFRSLTTREDPNLIGYWPMEDVAGGTRAASGLPFGKPVTVSPAVEFGQIPGSGGSDVQPDITQGGVFKTPPISGTMPWRVAFSFKTPGALAGTTRLCSLSSSASGQGVQILRYDLSLTTTGTSITGFAEDNTTTGAVTNTVTADDGEWHQVVMNATNDSGSNFELFVDGVLIRTISSVDAIGPLTQVILNPDNATVFDSVGQLMIWDNQVTSHTDVSIQSDVTDEFDLFNGFAGEAPDVRITRLCEEQNVMVTVSGTSTTLMGPQHPGTFIDLIRECEATDGGVLYDGFDQGLGYVCRSFRYNQNPAFTADMSAGQVGNPFEPIDDDQRTRNDVTVTNVSGSFAEFIDSDGYFGTQEIGTYDSSLSVNVFDDEDLDQIAAWNVHLGTVEGFRYPTLSLDLVAAPSLIPGFLGQSYSVFDRFQRTVVAGWGTPDIGVAYTLTGGGSNFSVTAGIGQINMASPGAAFYATSTAPPVDTDQYFTFTAPVLAVTADQRIALMSRVVDTSNHYAVHFILNTDHSISINIAKRVAGTYADIVAAAATGLTHTTTGVYTARFQTIGTTLRAKVWNSTDPEPVAWLQTGVDATYVNAGSVGIRATATTGSTATAPNAQISNYQVLIPNVPDISYRVDVTNVSSKALQHPTGTVSVFVEGYSMAIDLATWIVQNNCSPFAPWRVAVLNNAVLGVVGSKDSALTAAAAIGATSLSVNGTSIWTTAVGNFPQNISINEEVVACSAVANTKTDAFGRTTSNGWGNADTGQTYLRLGGIASDYSVGSGLGTHSLGSVNVSRNTLIPVAQVDVEQLIDFKIGVLATGNSIKPALVSRWTDSNNFYLCQLVYDTSHAISVTLQVRKAGVTTTLANRFSGLTHSISVTYRLRFNCVNGIMSARLWDASGSEPAAWNVTHIDPEDNPSAGLAGPGSILQTGNSNTLPVLITWDNYSVNNPQTFTVGATGLAHSYGDPVNVSSPAVLAL